MGLYKPLYHVARIYEECDDSENILFTSVEVLLTTWDKKKADDKWVELVKSQQGVYKSTITLDGSGRYLRYRTVIVTSNGIELMKETTKDETDNR